MGGSGGRLNYTDTDFRALQQRAEREAEEREIAAEVNARLNQELLVINDRDSDRIAEFLDEIEQAISEEITGFDRLLFGGSVAKHTYVDGLSDIDTLVIVDRADSDSLSSAELREQVRALLDARLGRDRVESVTAGNMAVTVRYRDGTEIQLLPALQRDGGIAISSPDGTTWTRDISPASFAGALTETNARQGRVFVPTIKLAKAILANRLPEGNRLSGYHVEALALRAFHDYTGPRNLKSMLTHFFESSAELVKGQIRDVTGQSQHVDSYLGSSGSAARRDMSATLSGVARTMRDSRAISDWERLLDG